MKPSAVADVFGDNWPIRRRLLFLALVWLAGNVQGIVLMSAFGSTDALMRDLAITMIGGFLSLIGMYVFGAIWDDRDKRKYIVQEEHPADGETKE